MASTPNLGLYKPTRDDYINVNRDISQNMQKIDDAFGQAVGTAELGIVVTGNVANMDVVAGQYVILRNSSISNVSDGLYIAKNNIPAGQAFTVDDLTECLKGGYNQLQMAMYPDYANMDPTDYFDNNAMTHFVVPKTGFWRIKIMTYNGYPCWIKVNGKTVVTDQRAASTWWCIDVLLPLCEGDELDMSHAGDMTSEMFYFPLRNP